MSKPRKDQDFRDLCEYVRTKILEYPDEIKLPKFMILRLRGLEKGQFLANTKAERQANYDCKVIMCTFQLQRFNILRSIKGKEFKSEKHKFNYIMIIIENNINDVANRFITLEQANERAKDINIEHTDDCAEYTSKSKNINIKGLNELW